VSEAIANAAEAVIVWATRGIDVCMNRYNAEPKQPKPRRERPAPAPEGRTPEPGPAKESE
jgi:hypothetical protein